ncbi:hypothetical protein GCM10023201_08910 [Actinomycetospora corticicola]|uniref:DUF3291 domain-containing protein n=1 Tax=Actinomycetospora corticicola TaxID=663602 RepID=A0A7Y9J531_9PSEU|nr:hypothetical protein [Actinomycetospora corticicola]
MGTLALYTFGLLDPAAEPTAMADFARRGAEIYRAVVRARGFLGRGDAHRDDDEGRWGAYALPLGLPDFAGHDPQVHIATLSRWQDVATARQFVYAGLHREALRLRHDWFFRGPWPGHVLWTIEDGARPCWADGVARLEALAHDGESAEHFTFGSPWARA